MDQTLKQRLIGASVLIALAVIFIPMIFDSPNDSTNKSISIEIPEEPKGLQQKTFSLDNNKISINDQQDPPLDKTISQQQKVIEVIDNSSSDNTKKDDSDPVTNENNDNKIQASEATKPDKGEIPIVVDKPPIETDNATMQDKPESNNKQSQTVLSDDSAPSFRVKLGVFTLEKNAQKLRSQILNHGLEAEVQNNDQTKLYEVYSNYFTNKELAQSYSNNIQKLNLKIGKPSILTLSKDQTKDLEIQIAKGFVVQVGSFSSKENSLKLRSQLRAKGFITFVDTITANNTQNYRVRVGPFVSEKDADANKLKIKRVLKLDGIIKAHELQQVIN